MFEHNEGIISERYIKQIPEDSGLIGQKAKLSLNEFETVAHILRFVLEKIVKAR